MSLFKSDNNDLHIIGLLDHYK